jgi:two-component system, NarL family, nitrate/nitrite response regulator NarL
MSGTFTNGRQAAAQVSVLVADAQPLYRDAVARAVRQDVALRLLAEEADGRAALTQIRRLRPDVAVIDLDLPELEGRGVIDAVVRDSLPTRVVVLSAALGADATFGAIGAGAAGYLSKSVTSDELRRAIRAAAVGDSLLDAPVQTVVAREIRLRHRDDRPLLSDRELDVLRLIADGLSGPEICRRLHLSKSTVKTHTTHLFEKLHVSDRAAAVAVAMRRGLLE